jgi:replicative DNA helicase
MAKTNVRVEPVPDEGAQRHYRTPPHNLEAEQGVLGALLVDSRAMEKIGDFHRADHFHIQAHRRIFHAIFDNDRTRPECIPVTLKAYFEQDEGLADVGGAEYLAELAASVITVINTLDYGAPLTTCIRPVN